MQNPNSISQLTLLRDPKLPLSQPAPNKESLLLQESIQSSQKGALLDVLHLHDVLARVSLAMLCHTISTARSLDGKRDNTEKYALGLISLLAEERAAGWYRLTREILKLPEAPSNSKDKSQKTRRPQPLIELLMRRLESSFRSFSKPVLHAAARVVQEMGRSRAAAHVVDLQDLDEGAYVNKNDTVDSFDSDMNDSSHPEEFILKLEVEILDNVINLVQSQIPKSGIG
ncbi:hypothetical protein F3Y22_tig00110946pilonHSYRG00073 [Hibiscus syriacus]|uniref:Uncharacterized protein n=1 Tax=Hibiscus syriacus TaxID=106335 RepID=A0A6A2ZDB3_HIBSY|nr:hypothetical protein F3Y22_tig00110946pilonHSYRG00073 [Hibiscus syriacus]